MKTSQTINNTFTNTQKILTWSGFHFLFRNIIVCLSCLVFVFFNCCLFLLISHRSILTIKLFVFLKIQFSSTLNSFWSFFFSSSNNFISLIMKCKESLTALRNKIYLFKWNRKLFFNSNSSLIFLIVLSRLFTFFFSQVTCHFVFFNSPMAQLQLSIGYEQKTTKPLFIIYFNQLKCIHLVNYISKLHHSIDIILVI